MYIPRGVVKYIIKKQMPPKFVQVVMNSLENILYYASIILYVIDCHLQLRFVNFTTSQHLFQSIVMIVIMVQLIVTIKFSILLCWLYFWNFHQEETFIKLMNLNLNNL